MPREPSAANTNSPAPRGASRGCSGRDDRRAVALGPRRRRSARHRTDQRQPVRGSPSASRRGREARRARSSVGGSSDGSPAKQLARLARWSSPRRRSMRDRPRPRSRRTTRAVDRRQHVAGRRAAGAAGARPGQRRRGRWLIWPRTAATGHSPPSRRGSRRRWRAPRCRPRRCAAARRVEQLPATVGAHERGHRRAVRTSTPDAGALDERPRQAARLDPAAAGIEPGRRRCDSRRRALASPRIERLHVVGRQPQRGEQRTHRGDAGCRHRRAQQTVECCRRTRMAADRQRRGGVRLRAPRRDESAHGGRRGRGRRRGTGRRGCPSLPAAIASRRSSSVLRQPRSASAHAVAQPARPRADDQRVALGGGPAALHARAAPAWHEAGREAARVMSRLRRLPRRFDARSRRRAAPVRRRGSSRRAASRLGRGEPRHGLAQARLATAAGLRAGAKSSSKKASTSRRCRAAPSLRRRTRAAAGPGLSSNARRCRFGVSGGQGLRRAAHAARRRRGRCGHAVGSSSDARSTMKSSWSQRRGSTRQASQAARKLARPPGR